MVGINNNRTYCDKGGENSEYSPDHNYIGNGKVVARFWCDKVEEIEFNILYDDEFEFDYHTKSLDFEHLVSSSKITYEQMSGYLGNKMGYAVHISKLKIFDRPKELSEFRYYAEKPNCQQCKLWQKYHEVDFCKIYPCNSIKLTKAPQNYCYIEGEE